MNEIQAHPCSALVAGQCRNGFPVTRGCLPIEHAGRWVAELEKALQFMLNVFGQDGLGDGAEGDAVEHARKAMRLPSNKGESRDGT